MKKLSSFEYQVLKTYFDLNEGPCSGGGAECTVTYTRDNDWKNTRNILVENGYLIKEECRLPDSPCIHVYCTSLAKGALYVYEMCRMLEVG
jgi:hypothetical protein